jgi:acyl carrier protein
MSEIDVAAFAKIRHIVERYGKRVPLNDDSPLISGGIIDSMAIVDILLDLQTAFAISIPASEVQPDDFDSIRKIGETLARFQ